MGRPSKFGRHTKKRRPAIVITPTQDIAAGEVFSVVALTTKIPDPLPSNHVKIPWQRDGMTGTGLKKPTVAVCTWILPIRDYDIHQFGGVAPTRVMIEIAKIINAREKPSEAEPPS